MKLRWLVAITFAFCTFFAFKLASISQHTEIQQNDIRETMQQIFDQHLGSKKLTNEIIRDSVKNYINQFDPNRIYLLEREVAPYFNLSQKDVAEIHQQYDENQYTVYHQLDALFQKAIERSRDFRKKIELDKAYLFYRKPKIAEPSNSFAKTLPELKERSQEDIERYIEMQKRRFGDAYVLKNTSQMIDRYESELKNHENQFLYVSINGSPLNVDQKKSLFVLHVLKALAKSLDNHTDVLTANEAYDMKIRLEKGYPGVGIILQQKPKGIFISRLIEKSPAQLSGQIKMNDRIVEINGIQVNTVSLNQALEMLRGESGSKVSLLLERKVKDRYHYIDKLIPVELTREFLTVNEGRVESSYDSVANGIIGKITLNSFYRGPNGISSDQDMLKAIKDLDKVGNLRGLVIDLRENTGGFLTEAVKVAGLFITNGVIVTAKYSDGHESVFRDIDHRVAFDGPIVVLTSKSTASAAEIVAQALQDYGVAIIVGDEHTYGKGTIQNQTVTGDHGDNEALYKVTIGKYYTVSGKTPNHKGVKADIVVPSHYANYVIGDELIEYNGDTIASSYKDQLQGVPSNWREWYLRFYIPTLQTKVHVWKDMLPILRKNSTYRMTKNKDYQLYLAASNEPEDPQDAEEEGEVSSIKNYGVEDLQMAEAVNIVKDMILLQNRMDAERSTKMAIQ